ncbi:circularly permuted type 2 ATP-grasp protein [Kineococcus rhizosphaerae]|uniref:Putative circularly permuted ATP-grasp superfamily protein n=1 Tax=Kineococcus rhizosphaerae TaxID=559628 RepID=A0A2T0R7V8_9ACTN|nr:circularly permuted type 2 ATP-grasp protein [Kineococcus rhizosphaerae]PRY17238.1 putative circularly permuted ATP-grasp superfamily protein [Kineococcus rhizosphaerae]
MRDVFEGYRDSPSGAAGARAADEMFDDAGRPRPEWRALASALSELPAAELRARADQLASTFLDRGVTFDYAGEERPFPLDVVPRIIDAVQWERVERGVAQRVRVLEAFLADVYGPMRAVADGVVPRAVITSSSHFHRAAVGVEPAGGVRVHVAGIDLVRDEDGDFRVLEDNVRVPSGVSYVLENRQALTQVLPEALQAHRVQPVAGYPQDLLAALRAAAPAGVDDPTVVVLTPGVYNSAYFEHSLLARAMGVELVEGRDLVCRGNRVYTRTTAGERRVDVVYRRVDDEFLDPVHFRRDSVLGCAGILNAARAGGVSIANAVGNGVADDKLVYTYVPELTKYYLGEELILGNVPTYRLEIPAEREEALDRLDELVVKPVDGSGGKGLVVCPDASAEQVEDLRRRVLADPRGWIAQPVVALSTVPTLSGSRLRPRHVDLRPFAVNDGQRVRVLRGGLTRVALREGSLVVNSSQGGGSKDTWVLAGDESTDEVERIAVRPAETDLAPAPQHSASDAGPGAGSEQAQQQQQQHEGQG